VAQEKVLLCDTPNQFARPLQVELREHSVVFHGYQEFLLTRDTVSVLPEDSNLQSKQKLLASYFQPRYLAKRTVLDLGANAGFFSFWALQKGAGKAIAVDVDENYLQAIENAKSRMEFTSLEIVNTNITDWNTPAEVVLAIALVHWIYSCTAFLGSLNAVVKKLAGLTKYLLLVEWVDPQDPAMQFFHHIDWNKHSVSGPYTLEEFERSLACHFVRYELIGHVSPTRRLYAAFGTEREIDLSGPLPPIMRNEALIYSRLLMREDGVEYWSRVYDGGDFIQKQTTLDLAEREAYFLSQLTSDYFPRVIEFKSETTYSWVKLEKIQGVSLKKVAESVLASASGLYELIYHCLCLLSELQAKRIVHRDIRPDNILMRNAKPVLIDFGWAISDAKPYFSPRPLGGSERPPDGSFCDVYSMGIMLKRFNDHRYPEFDLVLDLMAEEEPSLRVMDLGILKELSRVIIAR